MFPQCQQKGFSFGANMRAIRTFSALLLITSILIDQKLRLPLSYRVNSHNLQFKPAGATLLLECYVESLILPERRPVQSSEHRPETVLSIVDTDSRPTQTQAQCRDTTEIAECPAQHARKIRLKHIIHIFHHFLEFRLRQRSFKPIRVLITIPLSDSCHKRAL